MIYIKINFLKKVKFFKASFYVILSKNVKIYLIDIKKINTYQKVSFYIIFDSIIYFLISAIKMTKKSLKNLYPTIKILMDTLVIIKFL